MGGRAADAGARSFSMRNDRHARHVDEDDEDGQDQHAGEDAGHVEHALGLVDLVAEPGGRAEIFADDGADEGEAHRGVQRREHPGQRRRPIDVAQKLTLVHAEHARIGKHHRRDFANALIHVEEDDEEHEREAERHLRPDAEAEPQGEDRREHHARQRIRRLDVGIEHGGEQFLAREEEPEDDAAAGADQKGQDGLDESDPEMPPDLSAGEERPAPFQNIERRREEELNLLGRSGDRIDGQHMPQQQKDQADADLKNGQFQARHHAPSPWL